MAQITVSRELAPRVCVLCGGPAGEDDYCYGCGAYICEKCDEILVWGHSHKPEDHRKPAA